MMFRTVLTFFFAGLVCIVAVPVNALLVNGDFETGDLTSWTFFTTTNGKLTLGAPGFEPEVNNVLGSQAVMYFAGQDTFDDGVEEGGGVLQSFTVTQAGTYDISADIYTRHLSPAENLNAGTFNLLIDGNVIDTHDFGVVLGEQTLSDQLEGTVQLQAGTHELQILTTRRFVSSLLAHHVDNASVTLVPEPSSLGLLAFAGLAALRRSRRRRSA